MKLRSLRRGYVFLIAVLVTGVIATSTALSLLLLGWAATQNSQLVHAGAQAYEYGQRCIDEALQELKMNLGYLGDETKNYTNGTCDIHPIEGAGNEDRMLCVEGRAENDQSVHRFQVAIEEVLPNVRIASWEEVDCFSICPGATPYCP